MMDREQRGEAPPSDRLVVEHVMPQTLNQDWRNALGECADEIL